MGQGLSAIVRENLDIRVVPSEQPNNTEDQPERQQDIFYRGETPPIPSLEPSDEEPDEPPALISTDEEESDQGRDKKTTLWVLDADWSEPTQSGFCRVLRDL